MPVKNSMQRAGPGVFLRIAMMSGSIFCRIGFAKPMTKIALRQMSSPTKRANAFFSVDKWEIPRCTKIVVFDVPLPSAVPANALTTLHRIQGGTGCFATGQATALPWQKHSREINQRLCTGCHHHLNRFGS